MGWRGTNLCFCVIAGALLEGVLGHAKAEEPAPAELPPQCYAPEQREGIPGRYAREAMIAQPRLLERIEPAYPSEPSSSRQFFCAAFAFAVSAEGKAEAITALYNSHPGLDGVNFEEHARAALMRWQFAPGTVDLAPSRFVGFSAVFFKGYGETAVQHAELAAQSEYASHRVEGDVAGDWKAYGSSVSQAELEALALAEAEQISLEEATMRVAATAQAAQPVVYNSWVIAEDGSILTDDGIIPPEQEIFETSSEKDE